jgi:hypothetical protein
MPDVMRRRGAGSLIVAFGLGVALFPAAVAGADDRSRVVAAIRGYDQAVAAGDARAACGFLSERAKRKIGGSSCAATLREGLDLLPDTVRESFAHCKVRHVRVNRRRARARVICPRPIPPQSQLLVYEHGAWKLREAGA